MRFANLSALTLAAISLVSLAGCAAESASGAEPEEAVGSEADALTIIPLLSPHCAAPSEALFSVGDSSTWTSPSPCVATQEFMLATSSIDYGILEAKHTFKTTSATACATFRVNVNIQYYDYGSSSWKPFYSNAKVPKFSNGVCSAETGAIVRTSFVSNKWRVTASATMPSSGLTPNLDPITIVGLWTKGPDNLLNPQKW